MKRNAVALLVHPFKNRLIGRSELKKSIDTCLKNILELASEYQNIRLNVAVPGYMLELVDPLLRTSLRDVHKRGGIEWLATGFTEPFLSMSPRWLSRENIKDGIDMFLQHLGAKPAGFVPAFSNWEPSAIDMLRELGLQYAVLSRNLFSGECRTRCGCWATEHSGSSIVLFPVHGFHHYTAPANLEEWLHMQFAQDPDDTEENQGFSPMKIVTIHYLMPIESSGADPLRWLSSTVKMFDKLLLSYQTVRFGEYLSGGQVLGLQYIPPSLMFASDNSDTVHSFWNWLFTYDQVGVLHRRMMEVCDAVAGRPEARLREKLISQLYYVQDINRFLPGAESGFPHLADRLWTYRRLIDIDRAIHDADRVKGGQIRIVDYLRNGGKSIIMSNAALKLCIDHRNGGSVFEFDYKERSVNLTAGYDSRRHAVPNIRVPGKSKSAFTDRMLRHGTGPEDFMAGQFTEIGDFVGGRFDYKIKKTGSTAKAVLSRQGVLVQDGRNCPMHMEKVYSLENDNSAVSFVYQLSNHSLTAYRLTFAVELCFALPGAGAGLARIVSGKDVFRKPETDRFSFKERTEVVLEDRKAGFRITLATQKPVDVWCYPLIDPARKSGYQGTAVILSVPLALEGSSSWTLMGKCMVRRARPAGESDDAV